MKQLIITAYKLGWFIGSIDNVENNTLSEIELLMADRLGALVFTDTPQGQQAKSAYNEFLLSC